MSDPYSPYQAPSPYPQSGPGAYPDYATPYGQPAGPAGTANRAAQLAAWLVLVVVLLQVIQSGVTVYYYATAPVSEFMVEAQRAQFDQMGISEDAFRTIMAVSIGGCGGLIVLLLLVMFPFVRRGAKGATITTLVIAGLLALFAVIGLLSSAVQLSGVMDGPNMPKPQPWFIAIGALMGVVMTLVLIALIVYLVKSLIHAGRQAQVDTSAALAQQQAAWQEYYAEQPPQPPGDQSSGQ